METRVTLTHWPLGDVAEIFKVLFSNPFNKIVSWALAVKLLSDESFKISLIRNYPSQYCLISKSQYGITRPWWVKRRNTLRCLDQYTAPNSKYTQGECPRPQPHHPLKCRWVSPLLNTLRPRQDGRHFPDNVFKSIFMNENAWISIKIPLKFVAKGPINKIPALVQIMAWRRPGDKPLSESMMV